MHFNKLLDAINVVLLFYKEIQSKSFLSTLLGNLNTVVTKVKANSQVHKASEWKDNLPISHLGSMSLSTLSPENNRESFLWTLVWVKTRSSPKIIFDKQKLYIVVNSVNHFI